ncbi:hypothetical protein TUM3811_28190 [Shewanella algae]|nr:hypothetical protein TUM3811_28190 [Shewanella algae]
MIIIKDLTVSFLVFTTFGYIRFNVMYFSVLMSVYKSDDPLFLDRALRKSR